MYVSAEMSLNVIPFKLKIITAVLLLMFISSFLAASSPRSILADRHHTLPHVRW